MATDECLGAHAQGRASVLIQNGDWRGILSAAHRKHRGDGKSKWVPKSEPAASGTGSYGFIDTGGEMVTPLIHDPFDLDPFDLIALLFAFLALASTGSFTDWPR